MPAAGAAAIVGGSLISGYMASNAASDAAEAQGQASQYATDAQTELGYASIEAQLKAAEMSAEAIIGAAEASAGAAYGAAGQSASATREAALMQYEAIMKQIEMQKQFYYESKAAMEPYSFAGRAALDRLTTMVERGPGDFKKSPGYQFRLDQGNKNILANASATGGLDSGRTLKALQQYGQDYATTEYNNFLANYYQSLAPDQWLVGIGENAAAGQGNAAQSTAGMMSGAYTNLATAYGQQGANLVNIYGRQGSDLSGIYSSMGANLGQTYANQGNAIGSGLQNIGNVMAQGYMNQGNIAANASIGQANAWTGAINNMMSGLAMYGGSGGGFGFGQSTIAPYQSGGSYQTPQW